MTTDENILEEMLERATNPSKEIVDDLAVQMFCMIVKSNSDLVTKAHELIVKKMHSTNAIEASRAIGLLEECMSKGGLEFQKKSAKFTFLNELIALVLDKHAGTPAPVETKKRIMECLMLWTVEHQDKPKIHDAYDNLKKQVQLEHGPSTVNASSPSMGTAKVERSSILGKDDQLVAKLLKMGGEENYKKANLLIQRRVDQDARRTEFICHLKAELKKIESTMEVLDEMLDSYNSDAPGADAREIMQDLYNNCKHHNEQIARWPDFLGDSEPNFLEEVYNTKDLLMVVLLRYKELFENESYSKPEETSVKPAAIAATPITTTVLTPTNTDLLSELLGDTLSSSNSQDKNAPVTLKPKTTNHTLDELSEIFGSIESKGEGNKPQHPSDLMGNLDLLEPVSVFESENKKTAASNTATAAGNLTNGKDTKKGFKELREIDELSEEMFKQSLKEEQRLLTFKKESEKLTLNDMAKDKILTTMRLAANTSKTPVKSIETIEDNLKFQELLENKVIESKELKEKDNLKESQNIMQIGKSIEVTKDAVEEKQNNCTDNKSPPLPLKPLAEIDINLDNVTPLEEGQRVLLDDDDIQVSLNFTADRPSAHVSVIVMAVTNKSKMPVKDFQFEASVKKPCKVRLLTPTDTTMAPSKPFRPSAPINQVVLLLNPTEKAVDLTCIIGYKLGDDPDPIKESIMAKDIPYV